MQKEAIMGSGKKQAQKWYDSYEALRDYKDKYGNCRVKAGKKKDSSYSKLGKVSQINVCPLRVARGEYFRIVFCGSTYISVSLLIYLM